MEKLGWVQITAFPDLSVRKWKNWTEKSVKKLPVCGSSAFTVTERERDSKQRDCLPEIYDHKKDDFTF